MNTPVVCRFCLFVGFVLFANISSFAQLTLAISSTTRWTTTVATTNVTEAGNDFTGTFTSATNLKTLSVTNGNANSTAEKNGYNWSISVKKVDTTWDNTAKIFVKRTGNGTARSTSRTSTITGGTVFLQVSDTYQTFFTGYRGSTVIPIQCELRGVSVVMVSQTYDTTISYLVTSP